jgi:transposase
MDSDYFTTNVLDPLCEELIPRDRARHPKLLVVHMDNSSIDTSGATQRLMSEHQMSRMSQPPYSPNLAPNDSYLFPTLKNRLERIYTVDGDDLFEQLLEILREIPVDELEPIFTARIDRIREVNEGNGDYIA